MDVRCEACGELNPERARFCLACGTPIVRAGEAGREVRRTITVLFADVVGFTSLGERLDQESLRRVMARFYAEMRQAIEARGGTVAKFIGDAVMAVWGTPVVREDDALRAVQAAEGMRAALELLNDDLGLRWGVTLGLRTGINTGEVVVDPAKPADLLVGDTVNVAARLEQAAPAGEVLVGPETYRLVRDDTTLEPVEPLELKGKARPLSTWRLLDGLHPERRRGPRLQAPLVGRELELARLRSAFYGASGATETRMVTVIGSPGVGKSRLVAEFAAKVAAEALVLRGRCEAAGEGLTFLPIVEVLRTAAGIADHDDAAIARRKLGRLLFEDDPERDRIVEAASGLLADSPPLGVEETFWAVRRLLEALARTRPVVLILDDLHWAQPTLLDLHEHLVRWGRDAAVLIVAVARPELRDVRPAFTEPGPLAMDVVQLGPLADEQSRALVERLLGEADLPAGLAQRVLETTEGNPLFLGEMLRMLVDDGVLRREGDRWIARDESGVSVPPTIHALLAARIARLPEPERMVVERAAVIGQQFYLGAVAELSPPAVQGGVDEHLESLRRKELVAPEATTWLDEPVFRFHHVLVRDAAYRSLLKEARADLHERVAGWLESKSGEVDELAGFHLERAYAYRRELGPLDDAGRMLGERAAERLHAAGRRALLREDLPAARNLLGRALGPLDAGDPRRPEVLIDLAEALISAGDTAETENVIDELGLRSDGEDRITAWATAYACQLSLLAGAAGVREAIEVATNAALTLAAAGDPRGEAKAHHVAATGHALLGQVGSAETALDRALVAARTAGDRRRVTAVLSGAPRAALWGPSPIVRASGRCLDVVRILRMSPGNRHVEAAALRCQAVLEAMRGRDEAARQILAGCRVTLEELGLTLELHELATYAGIVELLAADPVAAERELRAARDGLSALGVDGDASRASALLARALLEQGRDLEADEATAFAEARGGDDLKAAVAWRGVRAEVLARRGEHASAIALAREAVALGETTDALADRADAHMALAAVLREAGRDDEAYDAAAQARSLYAAKDHTVGVAHAEELAVLGARPPGEPAEDRSRRRPVPEGIADFERGFYALMAAQDWDATRARLSPDWGIQDHRSHPIWQNLDRDGIVRALEAMAAEMPGWRIEPPDLLAALEDGRVAVVAGIARIAGDVRGSPWELAWGFVEVWKDGAGQVLEILDEDPADILERFDAVCVERFGVVLSPLARDPVAPAAVAFRADSLRHLHAADWEGVRELWAPGVERIDHRPIGLAHARGHDEILAETRAAFDATDDAQLREDVLGAAHAGDALVIATLHHFTATPRESGGRIESSFGQVGIVRDGRLARIEMYADDPVAVLARYDEVLTELTPVVAARPTDAETLGAWPGWARTALALTDGAPVDVTPLGGIRADDGRAVGVALLAPPGEHAAPFVAVARDGTLDRIERCHGEAQAMERFDEVSREVLDGCFLSPHARDAIDPRVVTMCADFIGAINARDWDRVRQHAGKGHAASDQRAIGWEDFSGADQLVTNLQSAVAEFPEAVLTCELVAGVVIGGRRVEAQIQRWTGTSAESGGDMEVAYGIVGGGPLHFGGPYVNDVVEDDPEALLASWDELVAAARASDTPVIRARRALVALLDDRSWEAAASLFAPGTVVHDHRTEDRTAGSAAVAALLRTEALQPLDAHRDDTVLGGAGDDVVAVDAGDGRFLVITADTDGRIARVDTFGDAASALARVQLVTRWRRDLGAWEELLRARDFDALRGRYSPDVRYLYAKGNVREEGRGPNGALGAWVAATRGAPDLEVQLDMVEPVSERVCVGRVRTGGTAPGGGRFEIVAPFVVQSDDEGRCVLIEVLDDGAEEAAHARAVVVDALRPRASVDTAATRARNALVRNLNARDWDRLAALLAPAVVLVDHRPAGHGRTDGREANVEALQSLATIVPTLRWDERIVATHGDDLVVTVAEVHGRGEHGVDDRAAFAQCTAVGRDGRIFRSDVYVTEEQALRRMRLVAAWQQGLGAWAEAVASRDAAQQETHFRPDMVVIDHRRGLRDKLTGVDQVLAFWELGGTTDVKLYLDVLEAAPHVALMTMSIRGRTELTGEYAVDALQLVAVDEEQRSQHVEIFDPDDRAAAVARYEQLAAEREPAGA